MYESPITKMCADIADQIMKQEEYAAMLTVRRTIGYSVDKDELIKALNYDRQQYKRATRTARRTL